MENLLNTAPLTMDRTGLSHDALKGEVAVVTGGSSNIGLATARSLAWLGAKVIIASRTPERGEAAAALINRENGPGTALFVSTDVADESKMKNMAARALDKYGKVDILVNNAMDMSLANPILKTSVTQIDRQYAIAVRGALLGIQLFVPGMQARRHGVVTYIATTFNYPFGPSNYCAVKSATVSMMISLAAELGPVASSGVAVFTYIPGLVGRGKPDKDHDTPSFKAPPAMPGYTGPYPPEDCAAALCYSIVHAAEIHGSGIIIQQALNRMNWKFPKPETLSEKDYDRLSDQITVRMFGYLGPGFSGMRKPLISINRSDSPDSARWDQPVK